jgi:IclR family acetate operon transcriptional repressor
VGKIYLSQQPANQAEKIIAEHGLSKSARRSLLNKEEYLAELDIVRKQGYAVDNEEYLPGVKAVAVALENQRGLPLAIWVVGFADSMTGGVIETIAAETQRTAASLRDVLDNRS